MCPKHFKKNTQTESSFSKKHTCCSLIYEKEKGKYLLKKHNYSDSSLFIRQRISNFATEMCSTDKLNIDIKNLPEGESVVTASLNDTFFMSIDNSEISQGDVHVEVSIRKSIHFSEIRFRATGTVTVTCDRCLDPLDIPVDVSHLLAVKYGTERLEDDDIIIITEEEPMVDMAWCVYESIVLSLPVKHVHAPGKCNPAMINMLNEHSATRSDDTAEEEAIDPRWSALKDLHLDN